MSSSTFWLQTTGDAPLASQTTCQDLLNDTLINRQRLAHRLDEVEEEDSADRPEVDLVREVVLREGDLREVDLGVVQEEVSEGETGKNGSRRNLSSPKRGSLPLD